MVSNDNLEYMRWLANKILDDYKLEHGPTVFRNRKNSICRIWPDHTYQIMFGYDGIDHVYAYGFREYVRVAKIQYNYSVHAGLHGLYNLVIHEAAHAVCDKLQPPANIRMQYHNEIFVATVELLQERYPFNESWRQYRAVQSAPKIAASK